MDEEFRAAAKEKISRLLARWKIVEESIKQAEQISTEAQIPAINELRYASRQLFNAMIQLDSVCLSDEQKEKITRRITIADQYLYNSEHDIADSIVTFYRQVTSDVEERFGRNVITTHFPRFPLFREHVKECERLIAESRGNYELRGENYGRLREKHVPQLMAMHENLIDAQVSAQEEILRTQQQLRLAEGRANALFWITVISLPLAIIGLLLTIYMWKITPEQYCKVHKKTIVLNWICSD